MSGLLPCRIHPAPKDTCACAQTFQVLLPFLYWYDILPICKVRYSIVVNQINSIDNPKKRIFIFTEFGEEVGGVVVSR